MDKDIIRIAESMFPTCEVSHNKNGDLLMATDGRWDKDSCITVESITDIKGTQVICGDYRFWTKTGKEVKGDMWNSKYASPVKENGDG